MYVHLKNKNIVRSFQSKWFALGHVLLIPTDNVPMFPSYFFTHNLHTKSFWIAGGVNTNNRDCNQCLAENFCKLIILLGGPAYTKSMTKTHH